MSQFQARHDIEGVETVIAADAGHAVRLEPDRAGQGRSEVHRRFRVTKAPVVLDSHFHWHSDVFTDGQVIDTVTPRPARSMVNTVKRRAEPRWDPAAHPTSWRVIWQYTLKRAVRDNQTLNTQEARAKALVDGTKKAKATRFVKTTASGQQLDETALTRARSLVGLKGYVSNIPVTLMEPGEVISKYHDL